jgi:hypothetical protein
MELPETPVEKQRLRAAQQIEVQKTSFQSRFTENSASCDEGRMIRASFYGLMPRGIRPCVSSQDEPQ